MFEQEQQVETMKAQIDERSTPFEKYLQMESIRDANVQLFYALLVKVRRPPFAPLSMPCYYQHKSPQASLEQRQTSISSLRLDLTHAPPSSPASVAVQYPDDLLPIVYTPGITFNTFNLLLGSMQVGPPLTV